MSNVAGPVERAKAVIRRRAETRAATLARAKAIVAKQKEAGV